jgi:hypothetical protein
MRMNGVSPAQRAAAGACIKERTSSPFVSPSRFFFLCRCCLDVRHMRTLTQAMYRSAASRFAVLKPEERMAWAAGGEERRDRRARRRDRGSLRPEGRAEDPIEERVDGIAARFDPTGEPRTQSRSASTGSRLAPTRWASRGPDRGTRRQDRGSLRLERRAEDPIGDRVDGIAARSDPIWDRTMPSASASTESRFDPTQSVIEQCDRRSGGRHHGLLKPGGCSRGRAPGPAGRG